MTAPVFTILLLLFLSKESREETATITFSAIFSYRFLILPRN